MDKKARQLLRDFILEKLNGKLENVPSFDVKTLRGDDKFGCPGPYFDCDDTEIMRAVYVVLWEDFLPDLSMETLGNGKKYRGDTMNSFHTMFGREIPERPGFYAGLEKYQPSDELRDQVREYSRKHCSTLGNFVVLPNLSAEKTTLNFYRGTNEWRDFFDRFLIRLRQVLCNEPDQDPVLKKLVQANSFCFDLFGGDTDFRRLIRGLLLEDYTGPAHGGEPQIIFPLNYHWKNPADRETYFADAAQYLDKAERIIENRGRQMASMLAEKI